MQKQMISVIVPVYNLEDYIERCVRSILAQTHRDLEVILVDDGSRDGSLEIMKRQAEEDDRVVVVHQENQGVTAARLNGLSRATGEWITFVDGDDEIAPWMYKRLLENAQTTNADISQCGYQRVRPGETPNGEFIAKQIIAFDRDTGIRELLLERRIEPGLCSKLYRRHLFTGLEERMDLSIKNNEDMLMNFFLFFSASQSVYEDVAPYYYWYRENSASHHALNEHQIYDPIRVRSIIAQNAHDSVKDAARDALVRVMLYKYAQLTMESGAEYGIHKKNVRAQLAAQREYFFLLSKRNRILAELICCAPAIFHVVFRLYVKVCLGGKYD